LLNPQSLNLYAYCKNDPVNSTDPQGLFDGFVNFSGGGFSFGFGSSGSAGNSFWTGVGRFLQGFLGNLFNSNHPGIFVIRSGFNTGSMEMSAPPPKLPGAGTAQDVQAPIEDNPINHCETFAYNAQRAADWALVAEKGDPRSKLTPRERVYVTAEIISRWYAGDWFGRGVFTWGAYFRRNYRHTASEEAVRHNQTALHRLNGQARAKGLIGREGFKTEYLDMKDNDDITHHVAAYLGLGLINARAMKDIYILSDWVTDNHEDVNSGEDAFWMGKGIYTSPGKLKDIGKLIKNKFCK
jgi:hypothetical protein